MVVSSRPAALASPAESGEQKRGTTVGTPVLWKVFTQERIRMTSCWVRTTGSVRVAGLLPLQIQCALHRRIPLGVKTVHR